MNEIWPTMCRFNKGLATYFCVANIAFAYYPHGAMWILGNSLFLLVYIWITPTVKTNGTAEHE